MYLWSRTSRLSIILLLSVTLLVTRIAGTHLHLCFDGMEPPVSMHLLDVDSHDGSDAAHNDRNVELPGATLAKAASTLADALFLFSAVLLCLLLLPDSVRHVRPRSRLAVFLESLKLLRPPLRGPPSPLPV
jgi:hypothetical protein